MNDKMTFWVRTLLLVPSQILRCLFGHYASACVTQEVCSCVLQVFAMCGSCDASRYRDGRRTVLKLLHDYKIKTGHTVFGVSTQCVGNLFSLAELFLFDILEPWQ